MPVHTRGARTTKRHWRKILAPLVIAPVISAAGLAVTSGSASAQCAVSDGLLSQTPSSERSDSVKCLQSALNERGFDAGPTDGWFGPVTTAAVTAFQQASGLTVDGWMGRETRTALGIERTTAAPAPQPARTAPVRRSAPAQATTSHRQAQRSSQGTTGASGVNWDRVAQCESGGNWSAGLRTNHVGTFSGGLMIMASAWRQYGGGEFASHAGAASREQQIIVAERIAARVGAARAWECPVG